MGEHRDAPPPSDSDEDAQNLENYRLKYLAEKQKRRELQSRIDNDRAANTPVAITPDQLEQTLTSSFATIINQLQRRPASGMPSPGSTNAPETFMGTSSKLLPSFFKRFEACLAEAGIVDPGQKLRHLVNYVGPQVREWIESEASFRQDDYVELKENLLALYNNPHKKAPYTERDEDQLSERTMVFETMAAKLLGARTITASTKDKLYFLSFAIPQRRDIREHLSKMYPMHPKDRPHPSDRVYMAARHLLVNDFDEEIKRRPRRTKDQRRTAYTTSSRR